MSDKLSKRKTTLTEDQNAEGRKSDHISLAEESRVSNFLLDDRFYYEPILKGHPSKSDVLETTFLGHTLNFPIWISSMTGGAEKARHINHNLARVCQEFGFGFALGSCRSLLDSDQYFKDFDVKSLMPDFPMYANLGIAQVQQLIDDRATDKISVMLDKLHADGLIVHVNPMQEWLQPEGDFIAKAPVETIKDLCSLVSTSIIVKEVGQGMGPQSMDALLNLPIDGIEFAAHGGTNFAMLEMMRAAPDILDNYDKFAKIGHSAAQMVDIYNDLTEFKKSNKTIIISGGIDGFLDGYYLINKINTKAIYGMASGFLKHALGEYDALREYAYKQTQGLLMANNLLTLR